MSQIKHILIFLIIFPISHSVSHPGSIDFQCKKISYLKKTSLCIFNDHKEMNEALARATCYLEGAFCEYPKYQLTSFDDKNLLQAKKLINGHNLEKKKLSNFTKAYQQACKEISPKFCLSKIEQDFLKKIEYLPTQLFIAVSKNSPLPYKNILSHEILHAYYFENNDYRKIIDSYWNNLSSKEKNIIIKYLGHHYDSSDGYLIRNEFQAYILQDNPFGAMGLLRKIAKKHKEALLNIIKNNKIKLFSNDGIFLLE